MVTLEPVAEVVSEEASLEAEPMLETEVVVSEPTRSSSSGVVRRGVVTAGDIDDRLNFAAFTRYLARAGKELGLPRLDLGAPVLVRIRALDGSPGAGARYSLRRPGADDAFHEGYAGAEGWIVDFPALLGGGKLGKVELRVFGETGQEVAREVVTTGQVAQVRSREGVTWEPDFLDLVVVVDTTGSMGDEIAFLQRELIGITRAAARKAPGVSIRYGLVAYRDQGDDYVVRSYGFTPQTGEMAGWLRGLRADGGGDYPEAAAAALRAGVALDWRRGEGERLMLHVADAPPHDTEAAAYLRAAAEAAETGVQIFTLGASGVAEESEYLMRQASVATGGRYLFLTDDSGVGYAHAEPTIDCYRVTKLSHLLRRILITELTGRRQEAEAGEVIREVGSYSAGICRN